MALRLVRFDVSSARNRERPPVRPALASAAMRRDQPALAPKLVLGVSEPSLSRKSVRETLPEKERLSFVFTW